MKLKPNGNSDEFMELVEDGLDYLGPRDLTQYFIRSVDMEKDQIGSIMIRVVLGRRLLGKKIVVFLLAIPEQISQEQY